MLFFSGARVSELLATHFFHCPIVNNKYDLTALKCDLEYLKDDLWIFKIMVRDDNPPDLSIKFNKQREVEILNQKRVLKSLMEESLNYRRFIVKRKKMKDVPRYLFINNNGNRFKYARVRQKFINICMNAGLGERIGRGNLTIHSTRHTFAAKWIDRLMDSEDIELDLLSRTLGHASVETTKEVYLHFYKQRKKDILKKLEDANY